MELINELCDRLHIPNRYRDLACLTSRYHLNCHRAHELRPAVALGTLEGLDAFRRPERFDRFLLACEADARGRKGKELEDYPQAGLFRKYRDACLAIDTKSADFNGLKGPQIAEASARTADRGDPKGQKTGGVKRIICVHTVANNAGDTEPAKILALIIKERDTPTTVPVHHYS